MTRTIAALVAAMLLTGCVTPSRTTDDYAHKAANTAEAVASAVQTARLAAKAAREHRITGPYATQLIAEAEDDADAAREAFDSVQPPNHRADELHDHLDELVSDALDHLRTLRVAVRRNELARLDRLAEPLGDLADKLETFEEQAA